eukprot:1633880-Karenia_brevis.AAC.1
MQKQIDHLTGELEFARSQLADFVARLEKLESTEAKTSTDMATLQRTVAVDLAAAESDIDPRFDRPQDFSKLRANCEG